MKRTIFVSMLALALMVALCGEAFSRSEPWGYVDPGTGDDHTWGGDFQVGADGPDGTIDDIGGGGWIPADMIITTIMFKWLGLSDIGGKTNVEADYIIENQVKFVEPIEPIITNTGGNQ